MKNDRRKEGKERTNEPTDSDYPLQISIHAFDPFQSSTFSSLSTLYFVYISVADADTVTTTAAVAPAPSSAPAFAVTSDCYYLHLTAAYII